MQLLSQRPFFVGICRNAASTKSNYLITSNYPVKSGVVRQFLPFLCEPIRRTSELSLNDIRGSGPAIKSGNHEKKTHLENYHCFFNDKIYDWDQSLIFHEKWYHWDISHG
jgi:hypothetical protein